MVNVKFMNKLHIFAMNGQTGEFIGNVPIDKKRVLAYTILTFFICVVICSIVSFSLYIITGGA